MCTRSKVRPLRAEEALADVQKLVQSIAADKIKLKAYRDMGKIQEQMEQIEQEKGSAKELDALSAKADVSPNNSALTMRWS